MAEEIPLAVALLTSLEESDGKTDQAHQHLESIDYFRICDPESACHVVEGMRKVQRHIEQMPELIVTKLPPHTGAPN